jgi:hypothetical protein
LKVVNRTFMLISELRIVHIARPMRRVALCSLLLLAGCVTVQPWERESLAHRTMTSQAPDRGCSTDFLGHVFDVREGAAGGTGKAGGGCGCN